MKVNVKSDQEICSIALEGDMTIYTAMQCKNDMLAPLQECRAIDVDLSGVYEIDTSGLQILALFLKETDIRNIRVRFSAVSESVREFLNFCGLGNVLGTPEDSAPCH